MQSKSLDKKLRTLDAGMTHAKDDQSLLALTAAKANAGVAADGRELNRGSAEAAAGMGSSNGGVGSNAQPEGGGAWANLTLAEKLRARCAGNTPPAAGAALKVEAFPPVESSAPGGDASAAPQAQGARSAGALAGGAEALHGEPAHSAVGFQHAVDAAGQARAFAAGVRLSQQGGDGVQRGVEDQRGAFALSEHTDGKKMMALKNLTKNAREQETAS